jgi:preprotein translocase subunit SecD
MRHFLFYVTILSALISTSSCNRQRKPDKIKLIDLNSVYEKNIADYVLATGWYNLSDTEPGFKRKLDKSEEIYFVDPKPILVKEHFDKVEIFETDFQGQYDDYIGLSIKINKQYVDLWAEATGKSIGKRLGLIIDNKLVNAPQVNARIEGGITALNRGVYTPKELEEFKKLIE